MASIPRFYVYLLARPNNKVFYVGKGQKKRVLDHEREAQSACPCHKCNVIRKIWRDGGEVQRYIVFTTDDEHEALAHERAQIALYGRKNLCNRTDGGEVIPPLTPEQQKAKGNGKRGKRFPHSEETKRKISAVQKGKKRGPLAKETCAKIAAAQKGKKRNSPSAEVRKKISASLLKSGGRRGQKQSPETIEKVRAKRIGQKIKVTPEERLNRAERIRRVGRPFQKGMQARNKGVPLSEEVKRKLSETTAHASGLQYDITSPDGAFYTTNHLKAFCQEHNLNYTSIFNNLKHNRPYKGWILVKRARDDLEMPT